jgi:hypothetical protein
MLAMAATTPSIAGAVAFDGSMLPEQQGWTVGASIIDPPYPFFTDGTAYTMNTIGIPVSASSAIHLWKKDVGIDVASGFSIEIVLRVIANPFGHNQFDAPIALMPSHTLSIGTAAERAQMIYFDEDAVGWADDSGSFALDTTDAFHSYRLDVAPDGIGRLYVDGELRISRPSFFTNGMIAFGDQTNDGDFGAVDAHFQVLSITVVPVPASLLLPVAFLHSRRRHR